MATSNDMASYFVSEMSERQISAREFFSTVLLESLDRYFGLKRALILIYDTDGRFRSWIKKSGVEIAGADHPCIKAFGGDMGDDLIYKDAVAEKLTYFNTEPKIYRATDCISPDEYDTSRLVRFIEDEFNMHYALALPFGINAYIRIVFFKSREEGDFTDEEVKDFEEIYKYIAISYKGFKKHEQSKIISNIQDEIISSGENAYIITDDFMHVMSYNKGAVELLSGILGKTAVTQLKNGEPCLWLPFLLEGNAGANEENIVVTKEIKDCIFKIYTYDQRYSHGIVDRYHWITISLKKKKSENETNAKPEITLTATERKVAEYLCAGLTYRKIAEEMTVSYHTVKNHVQNIFEKCGVQNRYELYKVLKH